MKLIDSQEKPALASILMILGLFVIGFMVLGSLIQMLVMLLFGLGLEEIVSGSSNPKAWWAMIVGQGLGSLLGFVGTAWFYWKIIEKKAWKDLNFSNNLSLPIFGVVVLIQITSMGFNGWLQDINQSIVFPEALKSLEAALKAMEDKLNETTEFFTNFTSFGQFLLAFLVIAVIAGIGEELIFRGLLLRKIYLGTNNIHLAVWISAFVFALIHFQFYGILPRMMLGVLFGYFYVWTGNIRVPIFAHIFNNGLAVVVMYLHNLKIIKADLETLDDIPSSMIVFSCIATIGLLFLLKNYVLTQQIQSDN